MRTLNIWAFHSEVIPVCRNARLDTSSGLKYPDGDKHGQAGWDVAVEFSSLETLAKKLVAGIGMPKQFCGNWLDDCEPIQRGELGRLALMAHGDQGGVLAVDGRSATSVLSAKSVSTYASALNTIGLFTREDATILLTGCLAGQGEAGTALLQALSSIWPGRLVVGFATVGYRHNGEMRKGGETCDYPGMRDTDAPAYLYVNPNKWDAVWGNFDKLPWASEKSINAKAVRNGTVEKCPPGELCAPPQPKPAPKRQPVPVKGILPRK